MAEVVELGGGCVDLDEFGSDSDVRKKGDCEAS
jgi:hypothetical protein